MPLIIQLVDPSIQVQEHPSGVKILVQLDPQSGIQVQTPMSPEGASQIAAKLDGRSIVVPPGGTMPSAPNNGSNAGG